MLAHHAGLELPLRFAFSPLLSFGALELDPRLGSHVPPHRLAEPSWLSVVDLLRGLWRRRRRPSSADLPVHRHPGLTDE